MNEGQLADLRCIEGASLALLRRRAAGVRHEVIGDEHPASLKRVQQRRGATCAHEQCGAIHLDHGEPPAVGRDGIALSCVGLLSKAQGVKLGLKRRPIDDFGR